MKIFYSIIFSIVSGILYHLGGRGKPFNTKYRDIGVPLCGIGILLVWWQPVNWCLLIPHFLLAFASMTTYWDKLFGYDNFYFHGFIASLSAFPLIWVGIDLRTLLLSSVVCAILMGMWSKINKNVLVEEFGRGFIYATTRLLLL